MTSCLRAGSMSFFYKKVYTYGIAFFGKTCRVCAGKVYAQADPDRLLEQDA